MEIYTDGSKNEKGLGSGVAIFADGNLTHQLRYKLAEKCSNNQAEQLAMVEALKITEEDANNTKKPPNCSHPHR